MSLLVTDRSDSRCDRLDTRSAAFAEPRHVIHRGGSRNLSPASKAVALVPSR